jgi:hypothetical protein
MNWACRLNSFFLRRKLRKLAGTYTLHLHRSVYGRWHGTLLDSEGKIRQENTHMSQTLLVETLLYSEIDRLKATPGFITSAI